MDPAHSSFFATVRQRVDQYFREKRITKHANGRMWAKAVFFLSGYAVLYGLLLTNLFEGWIMLLLAILLGAFAAFVGFNVSHDAIHGSFSASSRVNRILSYSFYLVGANPYVWSITHNLVHHTYTNIPGHDEDIEIAPGLIRLDPREKLRKPQRYQQYYAFLLYSLASLSWVFRKDYYKFFRRQGSVSHYDHPGIEYFNLFFYKILYYCFFLGIPLLVIDRPWWQVTGGFVLMHLAEGMVLGLVFQLAHVVEGTSFPQPNAQGNVEEAWAVHQMQTTANFAPRSAVANFLCGGLNMQIEHHLFPRICHIHYPAISAIVRQTAREQMIPYLENPSFLAALQSHYRLLRKMGRSKQQTVTPVLMTAPQ